MTRSRRSLYVSLFTALLIGACSSVNGSVFTFGDPEFDTFGIGAIQHDIKSITITFSPDPDPSDLTFVAEFFDPISAPSAFLADSLGGYIEFDIDRNPSTGETDLSGILGIPPSGLGIDVLVDLFSESFDPGNVELINPTDFSSIASVPISFGPTSFSLTIPLALLGGDVYLDMRLIVGTFGEPTDDLVINSLPEPASAMAWLGLLGICGLRRSARRRQRCNSQSGNR
jgi:hypothetical protein